LSDKDRQIFPNFAWALRDSQLQLVDPSGNPCSPNTYLESVLKEDEEKGLFDDKENEKNRLKRTIKQFFA
jgi:hypothetical protein